MDRIEKIKIGIDAWDFIKSIDDEIWEKIDTINFDPPYYTKAKNKNNNISKKGTHGKPLIFDDKMFMDKKKLAKIEKYIKNKGNFKWIKFHTNITKLNTKNKILIWHKSNVNHTALNGNCEFIELENVKLMYKHKVISTPLKYHTRVCSKTKKLMIELFKICESKFVLDLFAGFGNSIYASRQLGISIYACDIDKTLKWKPNILEKDKKFIF